MAAMQKALDAANAAKGAPSETKDESGINVVSKKPKTAAPKKRSKAANGQPTKDETAAPSKKPKTASKKRTAESAEFANEMASIPSMFKKKPVNSAKEAAEAMKESREVLKESQEAMSRLRKTRARALAEKEKKN